MMPELAREGLVIPIKRRLNAKDAFSGCCEGLRIQLSDELLDHEIFTSRDEARPFAGGQLR